jgi:hypothetical protein
MYEKGAEMEKVINLTPKNTIRLTPEKYLSLNTENRCKIRSTKFIPPFIGNKNLGYFVVTLKQPVYSRR